MKKLVYIFGDPVEHSKSPDMHNAAYLALGLDKDFEYLKKHVRRNELQDAVHMLRSDNVTGANITIPHKEAVLEYLDKIDPLAEKIGAVNTIINQKSKLLGLNTDGTGYLRSLQEYNNFSVKNKKIAIFGAGGAAKAITYVLAKEGALEIAIGEVDMDKAHKLAKVIPNARSYQSHSPQFLEIVGKSDLVINATPLGMSTQEDKTPLTDLSVIHPGQIYSDIVYAPKDTLFLRNARAKGAQVNYGYGMLLWQGVIAFHHFTGVPIEKIPVKVMEQTLL